ncbi:anti-sigma factor domain-containing protein [Pontibacillus sp. HMF3514]|uniref:anti-sigma factor domain-containing protein n=1 Tax=Pontibacillus sp. HMF3514 TaxID=2692425 RepID=UPI00131FE8A2|nr:anti-sigma factor domain-containing protein [Pontibacillus sp. HMF3514]QHE51215.1 anti-sigma factor domain-containing protein [Pontibacillus sp. HMF3514]
MRQGIVMEKHRRYSIVMTHDGSFQKAKPIPYSMPGDEVEFEPFEEKQWSFAVFPKKLKPNYRLVAMVAAFLIAILPLYSWFDSNRAYAYVNIDMNPSIEMKVNNKMKVIEMIPLNDDASLLVEKITDWKNKSVEKVTVTVIEKGEEIGLINNSKSVMVGVSYKKRMDQDKQITKLIDQYLQSNSLNLTVATFEVPDEIRKQAQKEKKSMNELFAKQYGNNVMKTSQNEQKGNDIDAEEEKAIKTFYNQGNNDDKKAPGSNNNKDNESNNGQTPPGQVNKEKQKDKKKEEDQKDKGKSKSSENPVGKEKGWAKNKEKQKEDQDDENHQENDLPSGLNKQKEELENLLQSLPPGIQKKLEQEGYEDIEEILDSLPPGILKKIDQSNLEDLRESLRRIDSDSFSDFNLDQENEDDEGERGKGKRHHDKDSKEEPPGQAKKKHDSKRGGKDHGKDKEENGHKDHKQNRD